MLRPGMFLQDRYEIMELIGSGGMSDVYKAKCHKLNRMIAIKVLKQEFSDDVNFVGKFKMEAQAAAGLSHPNIVNVYDVVDEEDIHYIVMELIEGITLKSYILKKGNLEVKETVGIAIQVAQGITAAHEQNIIHRDIKPQNMIVSRDGKVKVADFGIARAATMQTVNSAAMGSVHYISPEQARGGYSDARSDIYSLGITIYEMVTGHLPFEGDNTVTVALAHLEEPMTRPSIYNPGIPACLEQIILKCTEKKPERRYNSAAEVISDLRKVLLTPNDNFVKMVPGLDDSETITISPRELEIIQMGTNTYKPAARAKRKDVSINPKIERLMMWVGVFVAILIMAILILVFSKLSGMFRPGSDPNKSTVLQILESSSETVLKDTQVYMPEVVNLPQDIAEVKLKDNSLIMKVSGYEDSETHKKGYIIRQENAPGSIVPKYSTVNVVISNGSDQIKLSELGLNNVDGTSATKLMEAKGLRVVAHEEASSTVNKGTIIRYEPETAKFGDTVHIYISSGPEVAMKTVPLLVNRKAEEALQLLTDAGLLPGELSYTSSDTIPEGYIISQGIDEGTQLPEGSAIPYLISTGIAVTAAQKRYVASIDKTYNLSSLIGPGAMNSSVNVMIRLEQNVNGASVYRTLMEPKTLTGEMQLPVNFPVIEGEPGIGSGEVQVVDVDSATVIKAYPITFFAME